MPSRLNASIRLSKISALVFGAILDPSIAALHPMRDRRAPSTPHLADLRARIDLSPADIDFFIFPTKAATIRWDAAGSLHSQVSGGRRRRAAARLGGRQLAGRPTSPVARPAGAGRGRRRARPAAPRR